MLEEDKRPLFAGPWQLKNNQWQRIFYKGFEVVSLRERSGHREWRIKPLELLLGPTLERRIDVTPDRFASLSYSCFETTSDKLPGCKVKDLGALFPSWEIPKIVRAFIYTERLSLDYTIRPGDVISLIR